MVFARPRTAELSHAERIRSVVAASDSLSLTTVGASYDLIAMHTVEDGRLVLRVPDDTPLAAEMVCAPRGALGALVEFTDISPVRARDRVRARISLSGWLAPSGGRDGNVIPLQLDPGRACIQWDGRMHHVGLDEVFRAEPDALALQEAPMLAHLEDGHRDVVARLARLAAPDVRRGVVDVRPYAMDRYGFTLRYEYAQGHRDARLLFPTAVSDATEVGCQVEALLAQARKCRGAAHRP
ncbi:DUF2470 domain-containing protein [Streptomyces sp. ITFR-16]|uniref:DUF2470 domain-containing protein n=1 Tax=Streptomyces sp. ITFR-16 TaxID=3075198 RepID=UPI00288A8306|nr:DUF2470 domain-containing protein [Streptomyces sp. ITFR-16]WNI26623.1 DUF2470 domain-containing protein [Streptomyces sp. ITFR-16]